MPAVLALVLVVTLVLSACAAAPAAPGVQSTSLAAEQVLHIHQDIEPKIDPAWNTDNSRHRTLIEAVFEPLVRISKEGEILPGVAESWTSNDDFTEWTFTLGEGLAFSDSSPLTAADVQYTYARALTLLPAEQFESQGQTRALSVAAEQLLRDVVGAADVLSGAASAAPEDAITAPDDRTVVIRLATPRPDFLQFAGHPGLSIVQRANVEASTRDAVWWSKPVASGPFQIESWEPGQKIVLVPNEHYHGTKPTLTRIEMTIIADPQTSLVLFEDNQLDAVKLALNDVPNIRGQLVEQMVYVDDLQTTGLLINPIPPLDDIHVVRALAMAIDRSAIASQVLEGTVRPATSFTPNYLPGYNLEGYTPTPFDPAAAAEELALAKYAPEEITIRIWAPSARGGLYPGTRTVVSQAVAQMWQDFLGINVQMSESLSPADALETEAIHVIYNTQGANHTGPGAFVDRWVDFHTFASQANNANFGSIEVPGLFELAAAIHAAGPDEVWGLVLEAENLLKEYPQWIPLHYSRTYWLVKPWVENETIGRFWDWPALNEVQILEH
jgi:ABC-type transport system substrate-binding protein